MLSSWSVLWLYTSLLALTLLTIPSHPEFLAFCVLVLLESFEDLQKQEMIGLAMN